MEQADAQGRSHRFLKNTYRYSTQENQDERDPRLPAMPECKSQGKREQDLRNLQM